MSKILNQEGRVFGCLSAAEQQELKAAKVSGAKLEQAISRGGSVLYVELPFERVQWGPMSVYRVTLPDEPVKLTCPKCGMELEDRSAFAKDRAWVCIYGCAYSQLDSEQRPKMPSPREGYHFTEWRLPRQNEHYHRGYDEGLLRAARDHSGPDKYWIAVKDTVKPAPAPEKVRMIEPLGNYPDMKLMRDKINEIVEWSGAVTAWINTKGAV